MDSAVSRERLERVGGNEAKKWYDPPGLAHPGLSDSLGTGDEIAKSLKLFVPISLGL